MTIPETIVAMAVPRGTTIYGDKLTTIARDDEPVIGWVVRHIYTRDDRVCLQKIQG